MVIDATTSANLREYEEQLNKLDSDDIRVPNQSLILDYFCTDHEMTEFLRDEVFLESSRRHDTWRKVNQRARDGSKWIVDNEISLLLDLENNFSSRLWADIVRLTACHQAHKELVDFIDKTISYGHLCHVDNEQLSLSSGWKPEENSSPISSQKSNEQQGKQTLSKGTSHFQKQKEDSEPASDRHADNRLPLIVASVISLSILGLAIIGNYEMSSTNQENSSSDPSFSDSPETIQKLSDLEAEQKGAVLMCEHQPIIDKAKSINLVEPQNITRLNALIEISDKQIKFLNQKSAKGSKYWEDSSCTWGEEWFDKHAENQFRLFLAISRKCTVPAVQYHYTSDKEGKNVLSQGVYNAYGHSMGEIRLPYPQGEAYIRVNKVTCS